MYKLFCVFVLFYSTSTFSQSLDGFMGIKFGSSAETVKKIILAKPNAELEKEYSKDNTLFFKGLTFAGREVLMIGFKFIDNKFYRAMVGFKLSSSSEIYEVYKEIKNDLNNKYFVTTDEQEEYESPYKKGDGLTEQAIQKSKAHIHAYWEFKNIGSQSNSIGLSISNGFLISLNYQNGALAKMAETKEKTEKNKDY